MQLTKEQATDIVFGEYDGWTMLKDTLVRESVGKGCIACHAVFMHEASGNFYKLEWDEMDNEWGCDPFEYMDPNPVEVKLVEKVVQTWEPV